MKLERLIAADDHVLVREGMRTLLEGNRTSMHSPQGPAHGGVSNGVEERERRR